MRIGVLAEKTGVSRDTIRLYESMGLLKNISRPYKYNNYKEYSEENIERILFIINLKEFGFTLKECQTVLTTIENDDYDKTFQQKFIEAKLKDIDEKIKALMQLRVTLQKFADAGCEKKGILEYLK